MDLLVTKEKKRLCNILVSDSIGWGDHIIEDFGIQPGAEG